MDTETEDIISDCIKNARVIVIKLGSSLITKNGKINKENIERFVSLIERLWSDGYRVLLVSSGAIACANYPSNKKPDQITKHALASIGQVSLMNIYRKAFEKYGRRIGQILFSRDSIEKRSSYLNARQTIIQLLDMGVIPIINENDPLATNEIKFGENDILGALISGLLNADLYIIFSDVDGFYKNWNGENSQRLRIVNKVTKSLKKEALGKGSDNAVGGMITKLRAIELVEKFNIPTLLTSGNVSSLYENVFENHKGTLFITDKLKNSQVKIKSKKRWLLSYKETIGKIVIDEGAVKAMKLNKSLLAKGIKNHEGHFKNGDILDIVDNQSNIVARGITRFSSDELNKIRGHSSDEFENILGHSVSQEVIHRSDLVLF